MSVTGASRLLQEHRIRHLPVVEKGCLVGIITDRDIRRVLPSPATSLEAHELIYLLNRLTVGEVMTDKRSEEHTSEPQLLMRIQYAVTCLQTKHTTYTYI